MTLDSRNTIVALALALAACSSTSEPAASTAIDTVTTEALAGSTTSTTAADTTVTDTVVTTTTSGEDGAVQTRLLVASEGGIVAIDGGTTVTLTHEPSSIAVDDLMGGVVYQGPDAEGGHGDPEDTIVWWLPAGADAPQALLVPTGDQRLRLVGVEPIGGSPTVVYIRSENPGDFDTAKDTLRLYDFDTADITEIRTVGGWESGSGGITFGGGIFASNWFGEAYSGFDFFDTNGDDVTMVSDPYGDAICFDGVLEPGTEDSAAITGGPCFDNVAITPDGARLAYTTVLRDDEGIVRSLDLVVVDTTNGSEMHRITLRTEEPFSIASLDIRGELVLVNQRAFLTGDIEPAEVLDLETGSITALDVPGIARFSASTP